MPWRRHPILLVLMVAASGLIGRARAGGPPSPEESLAALRLADPTLKIELIASEPAVVGPVAIGWDEHGRLYVAEMSDYPVAPDGGRIKRLEDRDGDGRYEHATAFADGLHYPSGVLPWDGGVLVTAAPDLLFLKDTDGDGRADVRRVILTGFAEGNQQLRVNSPTWGLDNWVYLANGRSGGAVRRPDDPPDKAVPIPRNDLRVRPSTGAFEAVAGFSQFGLPRDDWGDRFPSWNTVPLRHVVLEERHLSGDPDDARAVAEVLDLADGGRVYSLAPSQRRFNAETVAYFNASCGPTIDRGGLLGDAYRGHAFVCEPLTSLVHRRRLDPAGPTFVARRVEPDREFLASPHPWFRPVNLATGPDGALYVVDFCRALVEHPAFVPEAQRDDVDFREGHDRGRLWRIGPREPGRKTAPRWPGEADLGALVADLTDPNGWRRDTAQRLLVERGDRAAVAPLRDLARESPRPTARAHAMWTLDGLAALDLDTLRAALRDPDPRVREQAVRLAEPRAAELARELVPLADDADERVRLRVAIALSGLNGDAARHTLVNIAARDADSPWAVQTILGGLGEEPLGFLTALTTNQPAWLDDPTPSRARFLSRLAALIGTRNRDSEISSLLNEIADARGEAASHALLTGLARGQSRLKTPRLAWTGPPPEPLRESVARVALIRAGAVAAAKADDRPAWLRALALEVLLETDAHEARAVLPSLLDASQPAELQSAAARGMARVATPSLAGTLLEGWDRLALATRRALLGSLVTTAPLAEPLIEAVEQGTVAAVELDPATREALRRLDDPRLRARIDALIHDQPAADRQAVVRSYEAALTLKPDATRGRALFERHCQACHAINGRGARVGPDLVSVAGRPEADLLAAILDPSREVAPDGIGVVVATKDGRTLTGLLAEESPAAVRLRRAEGLDEVVPRGEIEALRPTGRSLMPDGLEQVLGPQDVSDLIGLLRSPAPEPNR